MLWKSRFVLPDDPLFSAAAKRHDLELALVLAITEHESSFRVGAINPEPQWRYFWDVEAWKPWRTPAATEIASEKPPSDFTAPPDVPRDAEWWLQQCGLGLMQVQGGTARQLGFDGSFLTDLCGDAELGVEYGCRYLASRVGRYPKVEDAISAYNAGSVKMLADAQGRQVYSNQVYVDAILPLLAHYRAQIGG